MYKDHCFKKCAESNSERMSLWSYGQDYSDTLLDSVYHYAECE